MTSREFHHFSIFVFILTPAITDAQSIPCESKRAAASACTFDSDCDSAAMRDIWQPSASTPMMTIRVGFVVFRDGLDNNEAVSESKLAANFGQLNDDLRNYRIQFDWINSGDYLVTSPQFNHFYATCYPTPPAVSPFEECDCTPGDSECDPEVYAEAAMMEYGTAQTGLDASTSLNVFLALQNPNVSDFPWYEDVDSFLHGVRMVGSYIGDSDDCSGQTCQSITHEVGHALGLFHTHEGTGSGCTDCVEPTECDGTCSDEDCNLYGDLCCDTAAAGVHNCEGFDLLGGCGTGDWDFVDVSNYMSYSGDGCWDHFTAQQVSRMHCWVCHAHPGWIEDDDCNENGMPDVCEITRGSEDCDENGVPDECQSLGSCCIPSETCFECMTYLACKELDGNWGDSGDCSICAMSPAQ